MPPLAVNPLSQRESLDQQPSTARRAFINDSQHVMLDEAGKKLSLAKIFG